MGLSYYSNPFPFNDPHVAAPFTIGTFLLLSLAVYETKFKKDGVFHHEIFRQRNAWIAAIGICIEGGAFFAANTFYPLEDTVLFNPGTFKVGLRFSLLFFTATPVPIIVAWYSSRTRDIKYPSILGFVLFAAFYGK